VGLCANRRSAGRNNRHAKDHPTHAHKPPKRGVRKAGKGKSVNTSVRHSKVNHNLYRHYDSEGNLLYVGISIYAITRLYQHSIASLWFKQITRIEIQHYPDRDSVLKAEREAIVKEKPQYNAPKLDARLKVGLQAKRNSGIYLGCRIDSVDFKALTERAKALDTDRSKIVRQAINLWLAKNRPKAKG
jgi:hypothetical protein